VVDPARDSLYSYDSAGQKSINEARPWKKDPHYFKNVCISAVALLKMVMHARSGGSIEVMGLMQGSIQGDSFIVTDAFRLPVEGTETRVNAQEEANEYMVEYLRRAREVGQVENAVGWYHSHPGYGCWLSGIDVGTQMAQQTYSDPFLAVVVDPDRTVSAGKVEIGAFRTYSEGYTPQQQGLEDGFQTIPLAKIADFGAHSSRYYPLEVSHFKSTLDSTLLESLWNKYWVGTLSSNRLFTNRDYGTKQINDLAHKIGQGKIYAKAETRNGSLRNSSHLNDTPFDKVVSASNKIAAEEETGLLATEIKQRIFNGVWTGH
jgi:COP9 signalosome complex subunit 5